MSKPGDQAQVERASSALGDVDIGGWTQRFDLLSDPNRLEILLRLHRAPGICVGELAAVGRDVRKTLCHKHFGCCVSRVG